MNLNKFFSIFRMLNFSFVIRSYLIASLYLGIAYFLTKSQQPFPISFFLYVIASFLLFPLSKLVYEEIIGLIMGNNVFVLNGLFFLIWKFVVNYFLFALAPFIAPIGFLYLWYRFEQENSFTQNEE